ncbi:TA system VapC family ribonuclease toxin [Nocardioides sambongensis]|uniref:TA system VapC family ribonuclease toxin n=1 Tax=Nocardioides sambongensis TaxID=2589074 RepID=UPI0015E8731C|nr:TA system VapC family ribonuclease toxin [Nocardioides sambongensis]
MLFCDVNVLVHALRPEQSAEAERVRDWLESTIVSGMPIGVAELVLSAVARLTTSQRLFSPATTPAEFVEFSETLLAAPTVDVVRPGPRHWAIFTGLLTDHRLRGNDVPDAYLASIALERGATLVTRDRGFGRFAELRVLDPIG